MMKKLLPSTLYHLFISLWMLRGRETHTNSSNLGLMYYNGQGVEQDYKKAVYWWDKSAEQGDADAQHNLGLMYDNGQGVEQDYKKAVYWYRKQ